MHVYRAPVADIYQQDTSVCIENGAIVTNGKVQGYWYPEQKFKNFTLRFDYKFDRPEDLDPGDEFFDGNSGYLHAAERKIHEI